MRLHPCSSSPASDRFRIPRVMTSPTPDSLHRQSSANRSSKTYDTTPTELWRGMVSTNLRRVCTSIVSKRANEDGSMIRRLLFAVLLTSAAVSMMAQPADSLTGLWSSAWSFDPQLPRRVARDAKRRAVDGDDRRRHDIFRRQREEIWFAFGKRGAFRRR